MPADMTRYPAAWPEIRRAILERAGNRCEWCGAENHAIEHRDAEGSFFECDGLCDGESVRRAIRIVLTISHVNDPNPMNVDPANLAALCQRCHNRHDGPMRRAHAAETRRRKREEIGQRPLELGARARPTSRLEAGVAICAGPAAWLCTVGYGHVCEVSS